MKRMVLWPRSVWLACRVQGALEARLYDENIEVPSACFYSCVGIFHLDEAKI